MTRLPPYDRWGLLRLNPELGQLLKKLDKIKKLKLKRNKCVSGVSLPVIKAPFPSYLCVLPRHMLFVLWGHRTSGLLTDISTKLSKPAVEWNPPMTPVCVM